MCKVVLPAGSVRTVGTQTSHLYDVAGLSMDVVVVVAVVVVVVVVVAVVVVAVVDVVVAVVAVVAVYVFLFVPLLQKR